MCTRTLQFIPDTSKDACTYNTTSRAYNNTSRAYDNTSRDACTYTSKWIYNDKWQDTCTYMHTCTYIHTCIYNNTRRVAEGRPAPQTCMTHILEAHMFHTRVQHLHTSSIYIHTVPTADTQDRDTDTQDRAHSDRPSPKAETLHP